MTFKNHYILFPCYACVYEYFCHSTHMAVRGHGSQSSNLGALESSSPSEPSCQSPDNLALMANVMEMY